MSKKKTNKKGEIKMNENIEEVVNTNETVEETIIEEPVVEPEVTPEVAPEIEPELPEVGPEEPAVEDEEENTGVVAPAVVAGCARLNVRENPNKDAKVVCVIAMGNEVQVDLDNSTEDFYKINACVKDVLVEGYCMKQFINIK